MNRITKTVAVCGMVMAVTVNAVTVTWDGAPDGGGSSANTLWSTGSNWVGDTAPANPTSDLIKFLAAGGAPAGTVTNTLDASRQIGEWYILHNANAHKTDLAGQTLTVTGDLDVGWERYKASDAPDKYTTAWNCNMTVANGTLVIGSTGAKQMLSVGRRYWSFQKPTGSLTLDNVALDAHLSSLEVGAEYSLETGVAGVLDLQNATLVGGELAADKMLIGAGVAGNGQVKIGAGTGLTMIRAKTHFQLGGIMPTPGPNVGGGTGKIGLGNTDTLPAGVSIALGEWGSTRCDFRLGQAGWADFGTTNSLKTTSGGTFTGYLSNMIVGYKGYATGTLDIRTMTSVNINATMIQLSGNGPRNDSGRGYLYLPAGTVTTQDLSVGQSADLTWPLGYLQCDGTELTVNGTFVLGPTGQVRMNLSLGGFFRQLGDQQSIFATYLSNGRFTTDLATPVISMDGGYTYLAARFIPEPASVALLGLGALALLRRRR